LTIIGIVLFCVWRGYRSGLIRGVFGIVSLIVAILVANIAATAYSDEFKGMLNPFVGGIVDTTLSDLDEYQVDYEYIDNADQAEAFVTAYSALRQIGLPAPAAGRVAELAVGGDSELSLSERIADQLSGALAYIAVFVVAFVLIAIVFAVIGNLVGFVFSLPGLRLVDVIAGTAFGFAKGMLIVFALATFVRYFGLLALDIVEGTTVLNYLVNNNIVADMLGI